VAQGYKNIEEESVYLKIKSKKEDIYFLVWTTTPWTLAGNAALAVNGKMVYCLLQIADSKSKLILAKSRIGDVLKGVDYKIIEEFSGEELIKQYGVDGQDYEPIYPEGLTFSEAGERSYKLISADFVSDQNGTGIVHVAPAFGEDDYIWGYQQNDICVLKTVDEKGIELAGAGKGSFVKDADSEIKIDLEKRGILLKKEIISHDYPFCWRCETALLYFARDSWFIAMSKLRDQLLANNEKINWNPEYLKHGRFGNWLENVNDWAISRDRYWGTPLPVWKCEEEKCKKYKVIGDFSEFRSSKNTKVTKLVFIRHGEAANNLTRTNSCSSNKWHLTERGRKQAECLAQIMAEEKYDVLITSPVLRAKETAEIISQKIGLTPIVDDLIAEYDFGQWNEKCKKELIEGNKDYQQYKKIPTLEQKFVHKLGIDGESRAEVVERVGKFINKIVKNYPGKTVVIISHGGINAAIAKFANKISVPEYDHLEGITRHCQEYTYYINQKGEGFDPHKPYIDEIEFECSCGGVMKRTPEVMDVWLDSGTMPFSQYHWPFENEAKFNEQFPADFICEAVDQTRGWFYTLLAISTIIKGETAYKNVISVGHVLDEKGKKMSKSLSNIIYPMDAFAKYGADVIRYYFYSVNQPGEPKLFSDKEVISLSRNLILTLWNVFTFFMTYASIDGFVPKGDNKSDNLLDRWILAKMNQLKAEVVKSLDKYDSYRASNIILEFIAELSTWYIRRSRKRFWKSENDADKIDAYETLYIVLVDLLKLLAPFTPMFAETIYRNLRQENDVTSVHLAEFPLSEEFDKKIIEDMVQARKFVEAGLSKRAEAKIKVRQPLASLTYYGAKLEDGLEQIIADEVNVKKVENGGEAKEGQIVDLDLFITAGLKIEGLSRELIRSIQALRKKSGFEVENRIILNYETNSDILRQTFEKFGHEIAREVLATTTKTEKAEVEGAEEYDIEGEKIWIGISRAK